MKFEKISFEQFKKDVKLTITKNIPYLYTEKDWEDVYNRIKLPERATRGSAGYDFYSPVNFKLLHSKTITIPTGIRCSMPIDRVLMIFPRSGLGVKNGFVPCNLTGIIDSDYYYADNEGHIMMTMKCDKDINITQGQAFCQGVFLPYGITIDDEANSKRHGGFGSTSK